MVARIGRLSEVNTHLLVDWDHAASLPLTPEDFAASSAKKVHWCCHTCGYKWLGSINGRAGGHGCPFCVGKAVWPGRNDLATVRPEVVSWWADERDISTVLPGVYPQG